MHKRCLSLAFLVAIFMAQPALAATPVSGAMPAPVPSLLGSSGTMPVAAATPLPMNAVEATDMLLTMAMSLRDIRYRFGGIDPSTGFDCSGFVRYVYRHALGKVLPRNSRHQYGKGVEVARTALKPGDVVFFHTHGRRVSHVGIYLDAGRFIHAPSRGEHVRVDSLDSSYWSRHYAGARRYGVLAASSS